MMGIRSRLLTAALFPFGAALFALAYCQAPLYYSNQNQYFLHGLAAAGEGYLRDDWLANTLDPTPVFSALVEFTARFLHPWFFYVYFGVLFGIYGAAMLGIFAKLVGPEMAKRRWPVFLSLLFICHAALPRWCSYHWLGRDYPWYFQAGVAGQYLLGCMFQPSTFGVFLLAAIALFVWKRYWLAGICVAIAGTVHSTYLLPGALLTLGFLVALLQRRQLKTGLALGIMTLVLVLPITAYVLVTFAPTSEFTFSTAQNILVNQRIPHHARPDLWLDSYAVLQTVWVVAALILVWRTQLFAVLGVPFLLALVLTWIQVYTREMTLALLFPWRMSVVLVPVATTVILARLVGWPVLRLNGRLVQAISLAGVAGLVAGGIWISANRLAFRTDDEELPVIEFVRRTKAPGDVYLLPVRDPKLATTVHGAQSTDFKPLVERKADSQVIPVDFQRFRLATGAPIYVDFKAIPYKDGEVCEWSGRLLGQKYLPEFLGPWIIYQQDPRRNPALHWEPLPLLELRRMGITHLILPTGANWEVKGLERTYADSAYQVYHITAKAPLR